MSTRIRITKRTRGWRVEVPRWVDRGGGEFFAHSVDTTSWELAMALAKRILLWRGRYA